MSTLDEVMLCALILRDGKLGIVPTRYTLPCDDIPIVSVCGISDGRIFLGGYDGSLYEFEYENLVSKGPHLPKTNEQRLKDYYDGTATSIPLKDFSNAYQVLRNAGHSSPELCAHQSDQSNSPCAAMI